MLVLGGTAEAHELAAALQRAGFSVISSLAGRLEQPKLPPGEVRMGGFGGPAALASWLGEHDCAAVVDATHPFAVRISAAAVTACARARVPIARLERPSWREQEGDRWHWADDLASAAALAPQLGRRILLTIGRQGVAAFADVRTAWFLIRCIEPPDPPLPEHYQRLLDRGPYTLEGELALLARHAIDLVVTKHSGGDRTSAKLDAARRLGVPVLIVRRPPSPDVATVVDAASACDWVRSIVDVPSGDGAG